MLILGVGNRLRGDDAAGPEVLDRLGADLAHLGALELVEAHGLTPELAERLARHDDVLLLDADPTADAVTIALLEPGDAPARLPLGHALGPRELLQLARALYGRAPALWLCRVPAQRFEPGAALSPETAVEVERAVERVKVWLRARGA